MSSVEAEDLKRRFLALQDGLTDEVQRREQSAVFRRDDWTRPEGGGGQTHVLEGGQGFERAGIAFSDVSGSTLPEAASKRRPDLAGLPFRAMGVSLVFHPRNPHAPTTHLNVRFFSCFDPRGDVEAWWFGGGFDLTPHIPYKEDAVHWHRSAKAVCDRFGPDLYPECKEACDRYFHLPHRRENRGVGGLFFDDFNRLGPAQSQAFALAVGEAFAGAYFPIYDRRAGTPHDERERAFQLYRRGRYVEFNLLFDRGSRFGLLSGGRTESILMSMPPLARWEYDRQPEPGSFEEILVREFLHPRDWLGESEGE